MTRPARVGPAVGRSAGTAAALVPTLGERPLRTGLLRAAVAALAPHHEAAFAERQVFHPLLPFVEHNLGGTVNLRTASAFDSPGLHGGIHAEGDYNQMSTLHGTKYSAFIENTS